MISTDSPDASTSAAAPASPAALAETVFDVAETIQQNCSEIFNAMLPRVVERIVGPGEPAREALANGAMVINDCTMVLRLNDDADLVEFFCDLGLPAPHARESVYRTAMEMNLCRIYPGLTLGIHPESGRLVMTAAVHAMLMTDDDVCINTLQMLSQVVVQMRDERVFELED